MLAKIRRVLLIVWSITDNLRKILDYDKYCEIKDQTTGQNENYEWLKTRKVELLYLIFHQVF